MDLQKLTSTYKREYVNMVKEEEDNAEKQLEEKLS